MLKKILKTVSKIIGGIIVVIAVVIIAQIVNAPSQDELKQQAEAKRDKEKLDRLVDVCDLAIKESIVNKSTLDISTFGGDKFKDKEGNYRVIREFSAKNTFGLKQTFKATCTTDKNDKFDFQIHEVTTD